MDAFSGIFNFKKITNINGSKYLLANKNGIEVGFSPSKLLASPGGSVKLHRSTSRFEFIHSTG